MTAGRQHTGGAQAAHRRVWAPPRPLPGHSRAPPRRDVLTRGKILGGKYGWKFETFMPGKGFILCWLAKNNNINSNKSSGCIYNNNYMKHYMIFLHCRNSCDSRVFFDINIIDIIVKRRFCSFILCSVIILTQGYYLFL